MDGQHINSTRQNPSLTDDTIRLGSMLLAIGRHISRKRIQITSSLFVIVRHSVLLGFLIFIGVLGSNASALALSCEDPSERYTEAEVAEAITSMFPIPTGSDPTVLPKFSVWRGPVGYHLFGLDAASQQIIHDLAAEIRQRTDLDLWPDETAGYAEHTKLYLLFPDRLEDSYLHPRYRPLLDGGKTDREYLSDIDGKQSYSERYDGVLWPHIQIDRVAGEFTHYSATLMKFSTSFEIWKRVLQNTLFRALTLNSGLSYELETRVLLSGHLPNTVPEKPSPFDWAVLETLYNYEDPIPKRIQQGQIVLLNRVMRKLELAHCLVKGH